MARTNRPSDMAPGERERLRRLIDHGVSEDELAHRKFRGVNGKYRRYPKYIIFDIYARQEGRTHAETTHAN